MMEKNTLENIELKGEKIYLRKIDDDIENEYIENMMNISLETKILTSTTTIFSKKEIKKYLESISDDSSRLDLIILTIDNDALVGEVVLSDIDTKNRSAGLRIAIDQKENFGKGYGREALFLMLNHGFGMLNLHRVELEVLTINKRAIRVYKMLGFKEEGIKREACYFNHRYYDLMMMSILEDDFRKQFSIESDELLNIF